MKIFYQWDPGSYSHLASTEIARFLNVNVKEIIGLLDFDSVWEAVKDENIAVLPIENSYAGSIHHNIYNFLKYPHKIIGEYHFAVRHCLLSLETDISKVKEAYSHHQALSQTHIYLKNHQIFPKQYGDTAWAAKMIAEKNKYGVAAVASELAANIYHLNILEKDIQDQPGNTTRFFIIVGENTKGIQFKNMSKKMSIIFEALHQPASLYTCLGAFAQEGINLTKIESIPSLKGHFSYSFWVDIEIPDDEQKLHIALENLGKHTSEIKLLGNY